MVWKFKKVILVSVSVIFGVGIIYFALKESSTETTASEKQAEITNDLWRETLTLAKATSTNNPPLKKQIAIKGTSTTISLPPTTSEILARDVLVEYVATERAKSGSIITDAEAQAAALRLVEKTKIPIGKQYALKNLNISVDNSKTSRESYSAAMKTSLIKFATSGTKSDIDIIYMSQSDPTRKREYTKTSDRYEKLIKELLVIKTPSSIAPLHLRLIQSYANMHHNMSLMMDIFNDPIKGLAALTEYRNAVSNLSKIAQEYEKFL